LSAALEERIATSVDSMKAESSNFLAQLTGSFAKPAAENPTVVMVEAAY